MTTASITRVTVETIAGVFEAEKREQISGVVGSYEVTRQTILDDLATTHTVVGPDYPGSGDTPRSPEPLVLDEAFNYVQQWAPRVGEEVMNRFRAEMKKKGHNL